MNLESNYPKLEVKEPEFKRLMESLRQEVSNTSEHVSKISMFSCSLNHDSVDVFFTARQHRSDCITFGTNR